MTLKNIELSSVLRFVDQIDYHEGQIVSKTLSQNKSYSLTLFAFDQGEEISTHKSDGDAIVIVLDGTCQIMIDSKSYLLNKDESIIMPAQKPHSVYAKEKFKMLLVVVFSEEYICL